MKVEEVYRGGFHKIIKVNIPAEGEMEEHYSTSDAFLIVISGKAKLIFKKSGKVISLEAESTYLIPGLKPHTLKVSENLRGYLVLGPNGNIEPTGNKPPHIGRITDNY